METTIPRNVINDLVMLIEWADQGDASIEESRTTVRDWLVRELRKTGRSNMEHADFLRRRCGQQFAADVPVC